MNTMQDFITNGIRESCYRFQGRVAGSESEHACQKHFAMQLREWSDNVEIEDFKLHPTAFLGWIPICAVSMILSIFLIWKSTQSTAVLPIILAVCLTVFSALMLWFEFFRYRKFIDFLFPERTSHNVYAVRRSKNAPKQRIIFGGHADAAYEFRFIHIAKGKLGMPLIIGGVSGIILLTVSAVLILLNKIGGDNASWLYSIIEMAGLLYLPIFIAMLFFTNWKRITDGANDNLSACYAAMAVMKYLKENGIRYDDTEVCCLITGAEESGLRGAEYFAKKHKGELSHIPTIFISMDTLRETEQLQVYTNGMYGVQKSSDKVGALLQAAGAELGVNLAVAEPYPGAVDADAFAREGLLACGFCGVDHNPKPYYHTRMDCAENIDPECIELCTNICIRAAEIYDQYGKTRPTASA